MLSTYPNVSIHPVVSGLGCAHTTRDIAGRYELREALSKRPVGRWFRALDRNSQSDIGLLLINPELLPDEDSKNRFMGAVVEMRGIRHRHLLKLFDVGREGDSIYLTTQLSQPIRALFKSEGVLDYANSIADALDTVHRAGQTHGRLTPSDVCEAKQLIKVSGAGLYSDIPPAVGMRVWRGLSCFWAPEVVRGERPTPTADVYSLAAIAAVLLSGGQATEPHQALQELEKGNRAVYEALLPGLSVAPEDRPASPSLLVHRLANALEDDELDEQPTTYYVKMDADEFSVGDARTVLDLNVPPEVAAATPAGPAQRPSGANIKPRPVAAGGAVVPEDRLERAPTARGKGRAPSSAGAGASVRKKPRSPAHDRTVVERNKLLPESDKPRNVPAMVAMGPPVGPSSAEKRASQRQMPRPREVPPNADATGPTERMSTEQHPMGAMEASTAPATVASTNWAARPRGGDAHGARDVQRAARKSLPSSPADHRAREPSGPIRQQAGQTASQAAGRGARPGGAQQARQAASANRAVGDIESPRKPSGDKPHARPRQDHSIDSASAEPLEDLTEAGLEQGSNLTWLYMILAAVASATIAILIAMALFG